MNISYEIKRAEERIKSQYFIDTEGVVYRFKGNLEKIIDSPSIHYEIVYDLFPNVKSPKDYVMKLGWVLVGSNVYSGNVIHKEPTQAQINTLSRLGFKSIEIHTGVGEPIIKLNL